jgi:hypothetical protein
MFGADGGIGPVVQVATMKQSQLDIKWFDRTDDNLFKLDGPGGELAVSYGHDMTMDMSEHWVLQVSGDQGASQVLRLFTRFPCKVPSLSTSPEVPWWRLSLMFGGVRA